MPLRPVGNSAACQPNNRSSLSGCGEFLGRVEHHLDDALDIAVSGRQRADIHPQPAGDRRAHLVAVELLAFDLAGLETSSVRV